MKGTVIFDFDDTLADTVAFKAALAAAPKAEEIVARMAEFVFPQSLDLLGRLKAEGWTLALLTFGDPVWQADKVTKSGLLPFFDHVIYTPEAKITRVAEYMAWPKPLVFVNDHGGELDALERLLPEAKMVAVRGPKPLPKSVGAVLCEDLEGVYDVLSRV
jgi:FMN phosphatase YigB (HAD superfamily)